jgi:RimJ/RimL family protein N-acetyltransferase/predicted nucleotidyltransferase
MIGLEIPTGMKKKRQRIELRLPAKMPSVRPARHADDLKRIATWISAGRVEKCFAGGPPVSVDALKAYIKEQILTHDEYATRVMLLDREPFGFVDFARSGLVVELLGIYVQPRHRGNGLAHWTLSLLCAEWLYAGIQHVDARIYVENQNSLRLFESLGFVAFAEEDEGARRVLVLRRRISQLKRFSPSLPGYERLKGDNVVAAHLAFASLLSKQLAKVPGVQMVLGLGSIARGFADRWSDIDIAVLGKGKEMHSLWRGEKWFGEFDVDLFILDIEREPPSHWDLARRQAISEAVILSASSSGLTRAIGNCVKPKRPELRKLIVERLFDLAWIGYAPPQWRGRTYLGYQWSLPNDLWAQRGCLASAHSTVDQALDVLLEIIFLINGLLPPDPKWRRFLIDDVPWLPQNFEAHVEAVEFGARSKHAFPARTNALLKLVQEVATYLEQRQLLPSDMYEYHLRHSDLY